MDPYKVLGVSKDATDEEIKKAYRKLTKKHHPDLNAGSKEAEKTFKEIGQAYDLIGTKESREKFEQEENFSHYQQTQEQPHQRPFYHETQQGQDARYSNIFEGDYEDILSSMFRNSQGYGQASARSLDANYTMEISIEESVNGATKDIVLPSGKHLTVKIPKGIAEGTKLRFKGHGEQGQKQTGDAYVEIHFKSSKRYKIEGADLVSDLPITLDEAIHGAKVEFLTVDGAIMLTIPAGISSGTKLKIKGKGLINRATNLRGDQYVVIQITLPKHIDHELSQFIKKWSETHSYNPREVS